MEVTLYQGFSKRRNSTKQVNVQGVTKSVVLKEKCSVINPSFFISDVTGYTYLKAWNIYYFIDRILYDINGAQYIECTVDVLGTWKAQILATTAFVKYSSSNYSLLINDDRVVAIQDEFVTTKSVDSPFSQAVAADSVRYILTVIGKDGGLDRFYLGFAELADILQALMDKANDWVSSMFVGFADAMSAIVSLIEVPLINIPTGATRHVYIGALDLELLYDCSVLTDIYGGYLTDSEVIPIERVYSDFRMSSKYTSMSLYLPYVGNVSLSADDFIGAEDIVIKWVINAISRSVIYRVGDDRGHIIGVYSGTFGRQIPVSATQLTSVAKTVGDVASGSAIGAAILGLGASNPVGAGLTVAAAGSAIQTAVSGLSHVSQKSNSLIGGYDGTYAELLDDRIRFTIQEQKTRIEPSNLNALYGNTCSMVTPLTGLTGYVETVGFSIDIDILDDFRQMINKAMDSGVYIE